MFAANKAIVSVVIHASIVSNFDKATGYRQPWIYGGNETISLRQLVYLVICDSGLVYIEHLLLSWHPSNRFKPKRRIQFRFKRVPCSLLDGRLLIVLSCWKRAASNSMRDLRLLTEGTASA